MAMNLSPTPDSCVQDALIVSGFFGIVDGRRVIQLVEMHPPFSTRLHDTFVFGFVASLQFAVYIELLENLLYPFLHSFRAKCFQPVSDLIIREPLRHKLKGDDVVLRQLILVRKFNLFEMLILVTGFTLLCRLGFQIFHEQHGQEVHEVVIARFLQIGSKFVEFAEQARLLQNLPYVFIVLVVHRFFNIDYA